MVRMLPGFTSFVLITTNGLSFIDTKQYVTDGKTIYSPRFTRWEDIRREIYYSEYVYTT